MRATLDGRIIRYEIDDRFVNHGNRLAEVDYILPLPKGAAFENLELSINGEMVAGETMRAGQARAIYEEIVRKLRDPALVEWMGHDMLRTRRRGSRFIFQRSFFSAFSMRGPWGSTHRPR
ncbi:MAG: VIT domain-containing protein [Gemmatimonadetes bacterium]|nr:VIT domain-containing protein [Gemmatimonadota bacterium]